MERDAWKAMISFRLPWLTFTVKVASLYFLVSQRNRTQAAHPPLAYCWLSIWCRCSALSSSPSAIPRPLLNVGHPQRSPPLSWLYTSSSFPLSHHLSCPSFITSMRSMIRKSVFLIRNCPWNTFNVSIFRGPWCSLSVSTCHTQHISTYFSLHSSWLCRYFFSLRSQVSKPDVRTGSTADCSPFSWGRLGGCCSWHD